MDRVNVQFIGGLGLAILAAGLMLLSDGPISAPITLLIIGIVLIATSRDTKTLS